MSSNSGNITGHSVFFCTFLLETVLASPPQASSSSVKAAPGSKQAQANQPKQNSPTKERLRARVRQLQMKLLRLKKKVASQSKRKVEGKESVSEAIAVLSRHFSGPALDLILSQIRLSQRTKKGYRWNHQTKSLALTLLHASPKAYQILSKVFVLPSIQTLRKSVRSVQVYPGLSGKFLETFQKKVESLSDQSKVCALIFDEMAIKESVSYNAEKDQVEGFEDFGSFGRTKYVANHATVFMARGLSEKWKQPVGYYLSSGPMSSLMLKDLILLCINKLIALGLIVKLLICDQGSNNLSALQTHLRVTLESPFFFVNNLKVFFLYDPPHLLKSIRNNFKKYGFSVNDKQVLWKFIEQVYNVNSNFPISMVPRLTKKHIDLPPFSSLRVRYAAQVLSHSVGVGISTLVSLKVMDEDAMSTSFFVERFDQLFNVFNSSAPSSTQKYRFALSENSVHFAFLDECLAWFNDVKSLGPRQPACLKGWKMAIVCLKMLWADLCSNHSFRFLYTNCLNRLSGKLVLCDSWQRCAAGQS